MIATANPDAHLDEVAFLQYGWKSEPLRRACCKIAVAALKCPHSFWPDGIEFGDIRNEDKNCIGIAFRLMSRKFGLIQKSHGRKRSHADGANGREIAEYKTINMGKLRSFMRANNCLESAKEPQMDLFS